MNELKDRGTQTQTWRVGLEFQSSGGDTGAVRGCHMTRRGKSHVLRGAGRGSALRAGHVGAPAAPAEKRWPPSGICAGSRKWLWTTSVRLRGARPRGLKETEGKAAMSGPDPAPPPPPPASAAIRAGTGHPVPPPRRPGSAAQAQAPARQRPIPGPRVPGLARPGGWVGVGKRGTRICGPCGLGGRRVHRPRSPAAVGPEEAPAAQAPRLPARRPLPPLRPGRREVTRCSLALVGSAQGGRRGGRRRRWAGRSPRPRPPALQADPRLKPAPLRPPPARPFTARLPPFLASTPGRRQASPPAPRGCPRGHPRQACLVCPWARPGTRCPQVGGGDTTAEAASSACDPGAWCQRDLEFPVWLVLGPAEPG